MSKLQFLKSAVELKDFPVDTMPEIAVVGRSNAGKSSVINTLGGGRVAKVSSTPGKTRLLNLFTHKEGYRIVDMPGYGFAARSGDEVNSWRKMIEDFLLRRENLIAIMLIMDIRRDWADEEEMIWNLAKQRQLEFGTILTKTDKLARSAAMAKKTKFLKDVSFDCCLLVSNQTKQGFHEIEQTFFDWTHPKK